MNSDLEIFEYYHPEKKGRKRVYIKLVLPYIAVHIQSFKAEKNVSGIDILEFFISQNPEIIIFKTEVNVNFQDFCALGTQF